MNLNIIMENGYPRLIMSSFMAVIVGFGLLDDCGGSSRHYQYPRLSTYLAISKYPPTYIFYIKPI